MTRSIQRLRHEALAAWGAGCHDHALWLSEVAIGAATDKDGADRALQANLLVDRAIMLTELNRFIESEEHAQEALLRLETDALPNLHARAHEALAAALFHLEAPRDAARHWQRALEYWEMAGDADTDMRLRLAANSANAWWEVGENVRACDAARAGLSTAPDWIGASLGRMAARVLVRAILDGGGRQAEAWPVARTLAEASASARWERVVGYSLCGSLTLAEGDAQGAHRWFLRAETAAQEPAAESEEGVGVEDAVRLFCDHADALATLERWREVADRVQAALESVEAGLEGSLTRQRRARLLRSAGVASALGAVAATRREDVPLGFRLLEMGQAVELRGALLADLSAYLTAGSVTRSAFLQITARICAAQEAIGSEADDAKRRKLRSCIETLLDERHAMVFPERQRRILGR